MTPGKRFRPNRRTSHERKAWRITIKLPVVLERQTHKPKLLTTNEFTYEELGWDIGTAVNRAWKRVRMEPEIKGTTTRGAFISVQFLSIARRIDDPALRAEPEVEETMDFDRWLEEDFGREDGA